MARKLLPPGPDQVFRLAEPVLTRVFGPDTYRLGGGTALAAIWGHRHSTDVDLFMDGALYRPVVSNDEKRHLLESGLKEALEPELLEIANGFLRLNCSKGEIGIDTTPSPLGDVPPIDTIDGTTVALEPPIVILGRKIHDRMLKNGVLTLRDLFDIASAETYAPDDLAQVLNSLSEDDRSALCDELARLPRDWANTPVSGRHLIDATSPAGLAEDPAHCIEAVRRILGCHLRFGRLRSRSDAGIGEPPATTSGFEP